MEFLFESLRTALTLILALDFDVVDAVGTSLKVSIWSVILAATVGIPFGVAVAVNEFRGKRILITLINTLMALPTVVVGLVVYGFLSRQGPLGELSLLFSPAAMIIGQTVLALPIVVHYSLGAVRGADARILPTARTLGAGPLRCLIRLVLDVRFGIVAAVIAAFGRVVAEVGVAMMLGGNIRGYTRSMTTAIALETSKGEFAFGLALGIFLMAVALFINILFNVMQER
ncbi:MAG: ABC transporter permease [Desulfuromonadales bacterium]|nr:ABC transporter permease [Desulfuromonadales bacterium]